MSEDTPRAFSHVVPVSPEVLDNLIETRAAFFRWQQMTDEERDTHLTAAREERAATRAAAEPVPLTLERLLDELGISEEFARHYVQPYCGCDPFDEGGIYRCPHAEDEGIEPWGAA